MAMDIPAGSAGSGYLEAFMAITLSFGSQNSSEPDATTSH